MTASRASTRGIFNSGTFTNYAKITLGVGVGSDVGPTGVSNWQRLIPVINATRGLAAKSLVKSVLSLVRKPLALSLIEHELSLGDPAIVRGAIFELLRTGQLVAPSLHTQPLSMHTTVEPAP